MTIYKMETQKIANVLDNTDNGSSKFATRKWYVIHDQNNTKACKSLWLFRWIYIFVTGDTTAGYNRWWW